MLLLPSLLHRSKGVRRELHRFIREVCLCFGPPKTPHLRLAEVHVGGGA